MVLGGWGARLRLAQMSGHVARGAVRLRFLRTPQFEISLDPDLHTPCSRAPSLLPPSSGSSAPVAYPLWVRPTDGNWFLLLCRLRVRYFRGFVGVGRLHASHFTHAAPARRRCFDRSCSPVDSPLLYRLRVAFAFRALCRPPVPANLLYAETATPAGAIYDLVAPLCCRRSLLSASEIGFGALAPWAFYLGRHSRCISWHICNFYVAPFLIATAMRGGPMPRCPATPA